MAVSGINGIYVSAGKFFISQMANLIYFIKLIITYFLPYAHALLYLLSAKGPRLDS